MGETFSEDRFPEEGNPDEGESDEAGLSLQAEINTGIVRQATIALGILSIDKSLISSGFD